MAFDAVNSRVFAMFFGAAFGAVAVIAFELSGVAIFVALVAGAALGLAAASGPPQVVYTPKEGHYTRQAPPRGPSSPRSARATADARRLSRWRAKRRRNR